MNNAVSFISSLACMLSAGTLYLFGAYSSNFTSKLGYTQTQTNIIASFGGFGLYLSGPLVGAIVDRSGPNRIVVLAAFLLFSGYSLMGWTFSGSAPVSHYFLTAIYYLLVGLGSSCAYNAALATNVRNFDQRHHGFAVGVPVSLFGLSALIFSMISRFFFVPASPSNFIEARGIHAGIISSADKAKEELNTPAFLMFVGVVTGSLTLISGLYGLKERFPRRKRSEDYSGISPSTASTETNRLSIDSNQINSSPSASAIVSSSSPTAIAETTSNCSPASSSSDQNSRAAPRSFFLIETFKSTFISNLTTDPVAWRLFLPFMLMAGIGLMYINNVGTIVTIMTAPSAAGSNKDPTSTTSTYQSLHVSTISLFNCLGRIITGIVSDHVQVQYNIPRVALLTCAALVMSASQLIVYNLTSIDSLLFASALLGFSYGSVFSSTPAIVSQWFGVNEFGKNWGSFQMGPAMGGYLWNVMFGYLMDKKSSGSSAGCATGNSCFSPIFGFSTFVCLICSVVLFHLMRRQQHYRYVSLSP